MCTWKRSVKRCFSAFRCSLGVQFPFNSASTCSTHVYTLYQRKKRGTIAKYQRKKRDAIARYQRRKRTELRGRIGGVVPPASRRFPSTSPLFAPAALNGNPALRGYRFELSR